MAHQDDKYHRQAHHQEAWAHLLGYPVFGPDGGKIGTVKALWEDYTRQPAYLGIGTSWLDLGRIHVVPAQFATLSERRQCLRVPFEAEVIRNAPQCHAQDEITLSGETKIRDYFHRKGIGTGWGLGPARPARGRFQDEGTVQSADWSARDRLDAEEEDHSRSFRDRVRDAVDEGKAKLAGDTGKRIPEERPPLRNIYREAPVAEPMVPEGPEGSGRLRTYDGDDFIPLRQEGLETGRIGGFEDREDLPLR